MSGGLTTVCHEIRYLASLRVRDSVYEPVQLIAHVLSRDTGRRALEMLCTSKRFIKLPVDSEGFHKFTCS